MLMLRFELCQGKFIWRESRACDVFRPVYENPLGSSPSLREQDENSENVSFTAALTQAGLSCLEGVCHAIGGPLPCLLRALVITMDCVWM